MIPCVLYGAKSTEDTHGSIPTQLTDCRALAEREGWAIVGEDEDEGFSAYSGNRGPGLERAKEIAVTAAREHGRCVLVAQDADRFARGAGDEPGAVKAGLRRRKEAGLPQGPLPLGYMVEKEIVDGQVITRRVVDPEFSPIMERTFKLIDAGHTAAEIARIFNDEGLRQPARGDGPDRGFNSRQVRARLRNRVYLGGEKNYPRMPWLTDELCSARPKRADVLESTILSRLETSVGDVDDWIRERH